MENKEVLSEGFFVDKKTDQRKITVGNYTRGVERFWLLFPHLSWFLPYNSNYCWGAAKLNWTFPHLCRYPSSDWTLGDGSAEWSLYPCLKTTPFGHDPIENRTPVPETHPFRARPQRKPDPVPENHPFRARLQRKPDPVPETHPFRARLQRAPSACTSGMKSHCCTLQNYPNPNIHTVILSVGRDLHKTALTFAMKLL